MVKVLRQLHILFLLASLVLLHVMRESVQEYRHDAVFCCHKMSRWHCILLQEYRHDAVLGCKNIDMMLYFVARKST